MRFRKTLLAAAIAGTAALGVSAAPAVPAHATTYWLFDNANTHGTASGYCLNDPSNSTTNGTQMQLFGCAPTGAFGNAHGEENIQLIQGTGGWNGFYLLKLQNGKCLDATLGGGNGVKLQIWTCMTFGQDYNQIWGPITWSGSGSAGAWGVYSQPGGCIDNTNDSHVNGNPIQTWACGNPPDNAQSWDLDTP